MKKVKDTLHKLAKDQLEKSSKIDYSDISSKEILKKLQELEIYEIELELQNEELLSSKHEKEIIANKYSDLYDFAPSGYFTLDKNGEIVEINLAGARLIGIEREKLVNSKFGFFVSSDTKNIFNKFLDNVFNNKIKESCNITLINKKGSLIYVQVLGDYFVENKRECCFMIILDITETTKLSQKLIELSTHIEASMEKEKKRIAREIHDGLGASLTAIKIELSLLKREITSSPEIEKHISSMNNMIDNSAMMIRKISTELRPEVLEELGLIEALRYFSRDFKERTKIDIDFNVYPKDFKIDPTISTAIYKIFQEIMTNITKHAKASKVTIFLRKQKQQLNLRVVDDGVGITLKNFGDKRSFGIIGMQERTKLLKGKIDITGKRNVGTTIVVDVPL